MIRCFCFTALTLLMAASVMGQLNWVNVDSLYQPLPASVHVYKTVDSLNGKPNTAFYISAVLKDKSLSFETDTSSGRRLTPAQFYAKNQHPLVVVNTTFFSFATNQNLNLVIKEGKMVSYHVHSIAGRGKDTFTYRHPLGSAIGISKKRKADVAWLFTDSSKKFSYVFNGALPEKPVRDSLRNWHLTEAEKNLSASFAKWKMKSAVGGGPVLLQGGQIQIANNEELKFAGKAIDDKHPRTAMGYTGDGRLIILVVQGRFPGIAEGATLTQEAQLLKDLGCAEALNLDGGGSSCLLVNGKETIKPSDKEGQRAVPAVFLIRQK